MVIQGYLFGIAYGAFCLLLSLVLYKLGLPKKYTRKVVHILVGFEWFILYHFLGAGVHFLAVCLIFLALLTVTYKGKLLPMIASDADNAPGTVYYAVAMTGVAILGCFVPEVMLPFGIGIMCTSIGDGLAGTVGSLICRHNPKIYGNKTLFGTITNFFASSVSAFILSEMFTMGLVWWQILAIGLLSAELEIVTGLGLDNITITWGVTALACGFMYYPGITAYLAPILISPVIIGFAYKRNALTGWGIVAAVIMDLVVSLALGNFGFTILISFFIGSIAVDKIKKRAKNPGRNDIEAKGDKRDVIQVIANGFIPSVCAFCFVMSHGNTVFALAFVASLAEAFSDTAASGMGALSKRSYDVFKLKRCEKGMSGGMSVIGTLSALFGSVLISLIALMFQSKVFGVKFFVIALICAFIGSVFDSFLGSVFQVKYRCVSCSKLTEKPVHCGQRAEKYSGVSFMDNDFVNFFSGLFTASLALILGLLL